MHRICPVRHVRPKIAGAVVISGSTHNILGIFQSLFLCYQSALILVIFRLQHPDHALYLAPDDLIQFFLLGFNRFAVCAPQRQIRQKGKQKYGCKGKNTYT